MCKLVGAPLTFQEGVFAYKLIWMEVLPIPPVYGGALHRSARKTLHMLRQALDDVIIIIDGEKQMITVLK